jgi:prepilin-type N-terminal cleavage/methylation domain-containing protein/prepilin-type processing-associated H-X9-DG protein
MTCSFLPRRSSLGFTLIELIVVIAIVGMLVVLSVPELTRAKSRAQSTVCVNNLRQVGISVLGYIADNNNTFPMIEPNENDPVYGKPINDPNAENKEVEVQPMLEALEPYGVTEAVLKCPTDVRRTPSYFADRGTSYQWRVMVDDENATAPMIYGGRRGYGVRMVKPSRVTLCTDFEGIHGGRVNRLYGDGHVSKPY